MENTFNDNILNEFVETIRKFVEKYDTKKKGVSFFLVVTEDQEEGIQLAATLKGETSTIVKAVNYAIGNDKDLRMANLVNNLMALGKMKSDNKDEVINALDFLKNLATK